MKSWLEKNDIEMYSTHNEGKSVVAERFIRTIKNKIYKHMTSVSKNVYTGKLDDIVNEYNNTKDRTTKMKSIDVKDNTYIDFGKEVNDNDHKFKVDDDVRISKYKNIFAKGYTPNWSEEIFVIKNIKNTVPWTYVIDDLNAEEITGTFFEEELQKIVKQKLRIKKLIKKKGDKLYVKWKGYDNSFNSYKRFDGDINVKVDLSNYVTKADLKNVSHVDASSFALKSNLARLKTEVDKIDADKLITVPVDLAKVSNVIKNDVIKNTEYDKLVAKVSGIDNTKFVSKTKYEKDGSDFEDKIEKIDNKIPDATNLVKKTDFNTKVTEIEGKILDISSLAAKSALTVFQNKIPNINSLATKSALTVVENKIPDVSSLVKKADFNTKITEIEGKLSDASNLVKKTDLDTKLKKISDRVTKNKSKHLLVENEINKLKEFVLSYFRMGGEENYFGDNNINYLVFEVSLNHINFYDDSFYKPVFSWNSKGVSKQIIKAPRSSNNILSPTTENTLDHQRIKLKFNGSCLVQDQITYTPQTILNIYIVYEITKKIV